MERVAIGPNIEIQILRLSGHRVRLAITAPRELYISRIDAPSISEGDEHGSESRD